MRTWREVAVLAGDQTSVSAQMAAAMLTMLTMLTTIPPILQSPFQKRRKLSLQCFSAISLRGPVESGERCINTEALCVSVSESLLWLRKTKRTNYHRNAENVKSPNSCWWAVNNCSYFCCLQHGSQVLYEVVFNLNSTLAPLKPKRWNRPVIRNQLMNHADWVLKCIFPLSIVRNEHSVMGF